MTSVSLPNTVPSRATTLVPARLGAAAFVLAGILFVLYPLLRPFSDEVSLQGAAAFGSSNWLLAHMLAMVAFTLLPLGVFCLFLSLQRTAGGRLGFWGMVLTQVAVGLTLPFYGGEAYGLHAIGQEALRQQNDALLGMATVVRGGPGLIMFLVALLLLAVSAIVVAVALWRAPTYTKWSGLPLAVGFSLYIPQFFAAQPLRVAHGILVAVGCIWIAIELWRQERAG